MLAKDLVLDDDLGWMEELPEDAPEDVPEDVPEEEPAELLRVMPEIRQYLEPEDTGEGPGLRAILEHPDILTRAWRRAGLTAA